LLLCGCGLAKPQNAKPNDNIAQEGDNGKVENVPNNDEPPKKEVGNNGKVENVLINGEPQKPGIGDNGNAGKVPINDKDKGVVDKDFDKINDFGESPSMEVPNYLNANKANFAEWEKAAKAGNPKGQFLIGLCYFFGIVVEVNDKVADEWLRKADRQGNHLARLYLSIMGKLKPIRDYYRLGLEASQPGWI